MSGETTLTVIGNLTADPGLRFTPSGVAVASFTRRVHPPPVQRPERAVGGRRSAVPALQHLAPRRSHRPRRPTTTRPLETHPAAEPTARHPLPPPICPALGAGDDAQLSLDALWADADPTLADATWHLTGGTGSPSTSPTTQGHLSFDEHPVDETVGPASRSCELSDAGALLVLRLELGCQLDAGLSGDVNLLFQFRHELPPAASGKNPVPFRRRSLIIRVRLPGRFIRSRSEQL